MASRSKQVAQDDGPRDSRAAEPAGGTEDQDSAWQGRAVAEMREPSADGSDDADDADRACDSDEAAASSWVAA
jgi:hypothetical protein